jgi:acyl dehydratase
MSGPAPETRRPEAWVGTGTTFTKTVSESDVYLFAGITGDFGATHIDEEYMRNGRFGRRIAHGALLVGFMSAASARIHLGPTFVTVGYDRVRFSNPVFFGDTITVHYAFTEYDAERRRLYAAVECKNQRGETVATATNIRAFIGDRRPN